MTFTAHANAGIPNHIRHFAYTGAAIESLAPGLHGYKIWLRKWNG
jgi:hypothetical protein